MSKGGIRIARERRQREEANRQKQNLGGIEMTNLQQTGAEEIVIEEAIVSNPVQEEEIVLAPTEADVNPLINKEISAVLQHVKDTNLMSTIDAICERTAASTCAHRASTCHGWGWMGSGRP